MYNFPTSYYPLILMQCMTFYWTPVHAQSETAPGSTNPIAQCEQQPPSNHLRRSGQPAIPIGECQECQTFDQW